MEFLKELEQINLNPVIIVIILASGFWSKTYLKNLTKISIFGTKIEFTMAWKVLIIGGLFSTIYIGILYWKQTATPDIWAQFFYSYLFATSFYELMLKWLTKTIISKIPQENEGYPPPPPPPPPPPYPPYPPYPPPPPPTPSIDENLPSTN